MSIAEPSNVAAIPSLKLQSKKKSPRTSNGHNSFVDKAHLHSGPKNPLLDYRIYAAFSKIKPEHFLPAVQEAIRQGEKELEKVFELLPASETQVDGVLTYENTIHAIDKIEARFDKVIIPFAHLLNVHATSEMQEAYEEALPLIESFENKLTNSKEIHELYTRYSTTQEAQNLDGEKKRYLSQILQCLKYTGAQLNEEQRKRFNEIDLELAKLAEAYENNILESRTDIVITDLAKLDGVPKNDIQVLRTNADDMRRELIEKLKEIGKFSSDKAKKIANQKIPQGACLISKDDSTYIPVMKYANNQELRKELYVLFLQEASEGATRGIFEIPGQDGDSLNNLPIVIQKLKLRQEKAELLGSGTFADLGQESRMIKKSESVISFLTDLIEKISTQAKKEHQELIDFQKKIKYQNLRKDPNVLCPWDRAFLTEKIKKQKFGFDDQGISQYFELNKVLNSMFKLMSKLYGIEFRANNAIDKWHDDVKVYDVYDSQKQTKLGTVYFDLFARAPYKDSADTNVSELLAGSKNTKTLPQEVLVTNFTKPSKNRPTLMSPSNLKDLFHEFGHLMHHLLSENEIIGLSSSTVVHDFSEIPSLFHEHFIWDRNILKSMSKHYQNGNEIPDGLLDKLISSRNFHSASDFLETLIDSLFDMKLHLENNIENPNLIYKELANQYYPGGSGNNFAANVFPHIFAGNCASGYYAYPYAEVVAADLFAEFKKQGGLTNPIVSKKFIREGLLAPGDTVDAETIVERLLGRKPNDQAFLAQLAS